MFSAVPKPTLSKREIGICQRLKSARITIGATQEAISRTLQIQRSTLANYESEASPLRHDVALRFCRNVIISEEWLATGKFSALERAAQKQNVFRPGADLKFYETMFFRQCMDLLAEPVCNQIPPGALFSEAYDQFLAPVYAALIEKFLFSPRIVFNDADPPAVMVNFLNAFTERWLKTLGNKALGARRNPTDVQRQFLREVIEANARIFSQFLSQEADTSTRQPLEALKRSVRDLEAKLESSQPN